ncbi:MAG: class I SAM-dependent methyltransferase [Candidatus Nanoarchaeia archaeon]|nr:class I SAM-dependent methyltransferase [Candidatus Nanoarchaeia archaeon]
MLFLLQAMIMKMYNKLSQKGYEELYGDEQREKFMIIKQNVKLNGLTLDVGCGTLISREFFDNVIGIDPSEELIKDKENAFKASAEKIPFDDNYFDNVICVTVLQNVKDLDKAIKEMKRVCKGNFVFSVLRRVESFDIIVKKLKEEFKFNKQILTNKDLILIKHLK